MGCRKVVQSDGRIDVPRAKVLLLDLQATLEQLLLLLHVAQLAVRAGELRQRGSSSHVATAEVRLGDQQAALQDFLALPGVAQLRMSLRQVAQGVGHLRCVRPVLLFHSVPRELGELPERAALVRLLARRTSEVVPVALSYEVLHQAIQVHILRCATARAWVHEAVAVARCTCDGVGVLAVEAEAAGSLRPEQLKWRWIRRCR
mmetsp:Transcript_9804/g.13281  ORF Transcript_9804/g.13281 Transcript_9804/m.13281 type:complete len:203 (-) Transcript_9804:202-810(-)